MELDWASLHKDATTTLEGDFPVVIVETEAKKTANGDKDMIKYKAKIESGPYAGRPIWGNFTISPESPGAMRILFAHWAVLGIDGAFFQANPQAPVALIAQAMVGRKATVTLGIRQWNGQDREEVQAWKAPQFGGGGGGALGGLSGIPAGPSGTLGLQSTVSSTPATHPANALQAGSSGVPPMRMNTVPEVGAVATEPAVAENTEAPPALPF